MMALASITQDWLSGASPENSNPIAGAENVGVFAAGEGVCHV